MKVSLNWLRELVELPPTVPELVDLLTLAGVEVEGVETLGVAIPQVVVAQILESAPHPNADRLSVCKVDDGSGTQRQIVCGAKNYKVGDRVPLALPGAVLPGDFVIKVGKLRGVESQGMLCSAEELGLPKGEDGLLILPASSRIGGPIAELFPGDTILDLEITPNRADLLSHIGIAREIAVLTGRPLTVPPGPEDMEGFVGELIDVEPLECRFYSALDLAHVHVGPSPDWLRRKLEAVGLRPINNVVDITNFVMLETGQPLHAFDGDKLDGAIRVRLAHEGEEFAALDGRTYKLSAGQLVIADASRAIALGGIMGGEETGVTEATRNVILESAWFEPTLIRRTSRALGLATDSSYRFERGVDLAGVLPASQRAALLITQLAGGEPQELCIGLAEDSPEGFDPVAMFHETEGTVFSRMVPLRRARCAALLGVEVPEERIEQILTGFGLRRAGGGWEVPSFRQDLTREVDLIEEISRVTGLEMVPSRMQARFAPASAADRAYDSAMALRRALVAEGLHEARSLTLVPPQPLGLAFIQTSASDLLRVRNPMIDDQVALRPNLVHGLLQAVTDNLRAGAKAIRLFELGRVFATQAPEEFAHAALVLSGPPGESNWRTGQARDADLFDLKGVLSAVLGPEAVFEPEENPALALSLVIKIAGQFVGFAGQLWPAEARALDATAPVLFAEIDLGELENAGHSGGAKKYRDLPRFPATTRDIALLAPLSLAHQQITATLAAGDEPLLESVQFFDVFTDPTGVHVPADKKSLAYSLTYRASDRTLTADEVNAAHARLKERLKSSLGVTLRE
ncbi:MAG: phenylalanyl-tRNA synthetase beta chain [Chthoniobacter sp.]|jgi:phenylalanyl-tRNA synthetase beta chain|nr:phenylalanyl-tRNA synthetase beta chain [Chthoniobacter sp.]